MFLCPSHWSVTHIQLFFLFDLRASLLTLMDSDSRRRQDNRNILMAEGKANKDPVLEEIIGLFTILLYYLFVFYLQFCRVILGICMH